MIWASVAVTIAGCGDDPGSDAGSSTTGATAPTSTTTGADDAPSSRTSGDATGNTDPGADSTGPAATTTDPSTGSTSSSGDGDDTSGSSSTGAVSMVDCDALPPLPVPYEIQPGPTASEDFVFDADGHLVNIDQGNMLRARHGEASTLAFPGVGSWASGTAMLSTGDVIFADSGDNAVVRIRPDGTTQTLASGISYPNGLTVDMQDLVYVSEHAGERVLTIDPVSLEVTTVADGLDAPNGLAFDATYEHLYIVSFGGGTVHELEVATGTLELFASNVGGGALDGVVVDECGNVYVTDFASIGIFRLDGESVELAVDLSEETFWIPNLHFGSGVGGWDDSLLYVMDLDEDQVFVLDLGLKGIPLPHL